MNPVMSHEEFICLPNALLWHICKVNQENLEYMWKNDSCPKQPNKIFTSKLKGWMQKVQWVQDERKNKTKIKLRSSRPQRDAETRDSFQRITTFPCLTFRRRPALHMLLFNPRNAYGKSIPSLKLRKIEGCPVPSVRKRGLQLMLKGSRVPLRDRVARRRDYS